VKIALSTTHSIDLEALVDTRLLIQANSGGGKSWAIRRLLEQSHGRVQHLVLDPEGEFSTLRERFDYVLAARRGGDTAAEPRIAGLLAQRLLELQASAILDIYELKAHERIQFVRRFLEALVDAPKKLWHPCLVVVDEAHVYCPQQGEAESAGAVIDLATRGRKRGYCAVLATQRLSKLHKDAAAECNNKLIGRTGLDVDVKRAADELGFGKERWRELRELEAGHFFGFGPALAREVRAVHVGPVETTHPKAGSRIAAAPPPPREKVRALLPKLADLPAEVEERQKSIDDLKRDNAQLRRDLAAAKKSSPAPPPVKPGVPASALRVMRTVMQRAEAIATRIEKEAEAVTGLAADLELVVNGPDRPIGAEQPTAPVRTNGVARATQASPPRRPAGNGAAAPAAGNGAAISSSQQRIVNALIYLDWIGIAPAEKTQLALMADQSPTSGGFFNNLGRLRSLGLIDYPGPGMVAVTEAGRSAGSLRPDETPTTNAELLEQLCRRLSDSQARILRALVEHYPDHLAKDELAERTGQSPTSGGYFNNLGRLRTLGLIDYPAKGRVVACPVLFLEEPRA